MIATSRFRATPPFNDASPSQPRHHDNQMTSHRHSSSSSSTNNGAPSEPTIDYSSWSPRSHGNQLSSMTMQRYEATRLSLLQPLISDHQRTPFLLDTPNCNHTPVTKDQIPIPNTNQILIPNIEGTLPLQIFSLIFISRPITINPLSFLTSSPAHSRTWRDTQNAATVLTKEKYIVAPLAPSLSRPRREAINDVFIPRATDSRSPQTSFKNQTLSPHDQGPVQPKKRRAVDNNFTSPTQAHSHSHSFLPPLFQPHIPPACLADALADLHPVPDRISLSDPNTQPMLDPNHMLDMNPHLISGSNLNPNQVGMDPEPSTRKENPSFPHPFQAAPKKSTKGKKVATRRSQRLRAKLTPHCLSPKHPDKISAQTTKLPFDINLSEKPLDSTMTLQLLQASGLNITNTIKEMIEEAVNQDTADTEARSAPTTPLHDLIPPSNCQERT